MDKTKKYLKTDNSFGAYPPCNHVVVQLRSEGGVQIGNNSAAKNLTLCAKRGGRGGILGLHTKN